MIVQLQRDMDMLDPRVRRRISGDPKTTAFESSYVSSPNDPIIEFRTMTNDRFNAMHLENMLEVLLVCH